MAGIGYSGNYSSKKHWSHKYCHYCLRYVATIDKQNGRFCKICKFEVTDKPTTEEGQG